jgi:hypothetical protein
MPAANPPAEPREFRTLWSGGLARISESGRYRIVEAWGIVVGVRYDGWLLPDYRPSSI